MRHRRQAKMLGFKTAHRQAVLRNMVTSLIEHGRIVTTVPRAKELRKLADRMISLAKTGSLHAKRQAFSVVRSHKAVVRLFDHWGPQFTERPGGYTRIIRIGPRVGDAAMTSVVELVTASLEKTRSRSQGRRAPARPAPLIPAAAPETPPAGLGSAPSAEGTPPAPPAAAGGDPHASAPSDAGEPVAAASGVADPESGKTDTAGTDRSEEVKAG